MERNDQPSIDFHFAEKIKRTRFKVGTYSGFLRFDGGCPWVKLYVLCLSSVIYEVPYEQV